MSRRLILAACAAALAASITAVPVMAGEVTGSGVQEDQNQGRSWCSFSGLNDRVPKEGPTDTQAQSYGQDVAAARHNGEPKPAFAPGVACNPNRTPLGPNPNRTH